MSFFNDIEHLLYAVSRLFLAPVMLLIALALAYALVTLGAFAMEAWQRQRRSHQAALFRQANHPDGTPVASDDLELWIMRRLEWLRVVRSEEHTSELQSR